MRLMAERLLDEGHPPVYLQGEVARAICCGHELTMASDLVQRQLAARLQAARQQEEKEHDEAGLQIDAVLDAEPTQCARGKPHSRLESGY